MFVVSSQEGIIEYIYFILQYYYKTVLYYHACSGVTLHNVGNLRIFPKTWTVPPWPIVFVAVIPWYPGDVNVVSR